ncbi:MAG: methyltransferase domain-containing protein [Elusimicrobia bacterium]|nr:methyltransferase domain-containing protein [Elusimicrobiota bacterium]
MPQLTRCLVCGDESVSALFGLDSYPAYLLPVPLAAAREVRRERIELARCAACGHLQIGSFDKEVQRLIYEVYYNHYVVDSAELLIPHYRLPFERFLAKLAGMETVKKGRLLEIGCSSGQRIPALSALCRSYTGIDPSERIEAARKDNPDKAFIRGYFPDALGDETFDAVVSQFNLEHIADVRAFAENARRALSDDGIFVVQVPDIGEFFRTMQPNFLAHEHLQYFTRRSLANLLTSTGFVPIEWGEQGPSLIVAARKAAAKGTCAPATAEERESAMRHEALFIAKPGLPDRPVVFYGVGPLLHWLLSGRAVTAGDRVVDDNPSYEGLALPGSGIPVEKPSAGLFRDVPDVVLSLNQVYHPAVKKKLSAYGLKLNVLASEAGRWVRSELP